MTQKYLVYDFNADTTMISVTSLIGRAALLALIGFGYLDPLPGVIILVLATIVTTIAYRPYKNIYKDYEVEFQ